MNPTPAQVFSSTMACGLTSSILASSDASIWLMTRTMCSTGWGLSHYPRTTAAWLRVLSEHRGEIKRLLLDQSFIAGLGNIYVSESLWHARIHPARSAASLTSPESFRLHTAIVQVLRSAVADGGTSLDDRQYVYPNRDLGGHQTHLMVYDRSGNACPRCGYVVERTVQGQRSTYFCPVCQTMP